VVSLALLACAAPAAPQTASVPPPIPRSAEPEPVRYVAVGASDTVGVGAADPRTGSWPARLAARLPPGSSFTSVGVSGSLAAQAAREQLAAAIATRPTVVSIWLAVNDLAARIAPEQYGRDLRTVVDPLVAATTARIYVGNVPDLRAVPAFSGVDPQVLSATIAAYNDQIARIAASHAGRVMVVDLFTGSADLTTASTVSSDGFHPSDRGYALIADRFAEALRRDGHALR
jgi:lysophospholipase L1-like esterase